MRFGWDFLRTIRLLKVKSVVGTDIWRATERYIVWSTGSQWVRKHCIPMKGSPKTSSYGRISRSANALISVRDFSMKVSRRSSNKASSFTSPGDWYSKRHGEFVIIVQDSIQQERFVMTVPVFKDSFASFEQLESLTEYYRLQ